MERQRAYLYLTLTCMTLWIMLCHAAVFADESLRVTRGSPDQRIVTDQWAVHIGSGENPDTAATEMGAVNLGKIAGLPDTYLFRFPESRLRNNADTVHNKLKQHKKIRWFEQQVARWRYPRSMPEDPLFPQQWHLKNTGQSGGTPGEDIDVTPVWESGNTGQNIVIGVMDDGLQYTHPDIAPNYRSDLSYDFNFDDPDPTPYSFDYHGTACSGVAASASNAACGVGAAYGSYLAGLRIAAAAATDADEALAFSYKTDAIQIFSSSWGPTDDGKRLEGPGTLGLAALENNAINGREGLGTIYVWAGGNGNLRGDNVNYDGYANSRYTIAVGATDHNGRQTYYSEPGASLIVCTPSDDNVSAYIITTNLSGCKSDFGGTSASAPMLAGVVALMLHANPNLGWRDVQHILIKSAVQNDSADSDWKFNRAGFHINHKYGFGRINAAKAAALSKVWQNVPKESASAFGVSDMNKTIPDNDSAGISSTIAMSQTFRLEHAEVIFKATHPYRGDLKIVLTSPSGTQSVLAESHSDSNADYDWKFMSARHWGEVSSGTWTLNVSDLKSGNTGIFDSWGLVLYGNYPDLSDVIGILRLVTDIPAAGKFMVDVNGDKKTGMEEAVYLLQDIAGLRQ